VASIQKLPKPPADVRIIAALVVIFVLLGGIVAVVYFDLEASLTALKNDNADLSSKVSQLQDLLEQSHLNQTSSLPAVQIYNQTVASVVLIENQKTTGTADEGTGFVYDTEGHIVTNNHVVEDAATVTVTFFDGTSETAQITGTDVYSDLALIKVDSLPNQSKPLLIRNSTSLMIGEPVYAIGNPFGLSDSMTSGIVSQLERELRLSDLGIPPPEGNYSIVDLIQIDAAVNHGSSGGPLLDGDGLVIGVTFALETGNTNLNGFIGIAYAVPSVLLMRVIPALKSTGHYDHPYMGISYDPNYTDGLLVTTVVPGGPAANAGLKAGDVITQVDGLQVSRAVDLVIYLERYKSPGDTIDLMIKGSSEHITLTLGAR
jgi:S1-C subfamily serine protease